MMNEPAPISEIERLYSVERWSVPKIAEHFGVTRQAVYERMRNSGLALDRSRRKRTPHLEVDPRELRQLFEKERRSIAQVAEQFGTTRSRVNEALKRHNIRSLARGTRPKKYPQVAGLKVGEHFDVPLPNDELASLNAIRRDAKRLGFRVALRRVDAGTARITRTPLLTPEAVASMYRSGMTKTAIAEIFLSDRNNISRILRRIGIKSRKS